MILDFHIHIFPDKIAARSIKHLSLASHSKAFLDGTLSALDRSMQDSKINFSVNLPVATSPGQARKVNHNLAGDSDRMIQQGVITFGCMHPDCEDYKDQLRFLKEHKIPGIKLHPAYQNTDLDDIRMMRIIDAASALDMIVLTHAGIDIGIPDHDYASVPQIIRVMDEVHPKRFVLAHMGGWACWDAVESDLAGADLWLDTAFSIGPVIPAENDPVPPILSHNLSDEAFVRLSRKHGINRILFATDSPWSDQTEYVNRFSNLPFSDDEKEFILWKNGADLLGLSSYSERQKQLDVHYKSDTTF